MNHRKNLVIDFSKIISEMPESDREALVSLGKKHLSAMSESRPQISFSECQERIAAMIQSCPEAFSSGHLGGISAMLRDILKSAPLENIDENTLAECCDDFEEIVNDVSSDSSLNWQQDKYHKFKEWCKKYPLYAAAVLLVWQIIISYFVNQLPGLDTIIPKAKIQNEQSSNEDSFGDLIDEWIAERNIERGPSPFYELDHSAYPLGDENALMKDEN